MIVGKIVVTFKLDEEICLKLKDIAKNEGRGLSEILSEALAHWLEKKKSTSVRDFITFTKEQNSRGKSWTEIASLVSERYHISLNKEQLKSLSKT